VESSLYRKNQVDVHACELCRTRYKRSLLRTMLYRAKRLSSKQIAFFQEFSNLKRIFFLNQNILGSSSTRPSTTSSSLQTRVSLYPIAYRTEALTDNYQKSADVVRRRLRDLGRKIKQDLEPVFTSKQVMDELRITELKPPVVKQQNVVSEFKCVLCDTNYIGYTCRLLHQRVDKHKHSVIGKCFEENIT